MARAARWAAFTHLRLSWECAGKPLSTLASDLWWQSQQAPSIGCESGLEAALNAHARHVGSHHDKSMIETVRRELRKSSPSAETVELGRRGLLWRSHTDGAFTVVPWLARLWLQQGCTERERSLLRNSLSGGYNTVPAQVDSSPPLQQYWSDPEVAAPTTLKFTVTGGNPVNLATGFFTSDAPSFAVDNRPLPRGIPFSLNYDVLPAGNKIVR